MTTVDVNAIKKHGQDLKNTIRESFDQGAVSAKAKLGSLELALSNNRNHHQAGVVKELTEALTTLQEQCSPENKKSVIAIVEQIQRLSEDSSNRGGSHLPKNEWPLELDGALLSVSLCTTFVELQEKAEALVDLSKRVAIDIEQLINNE